MSSRKQPWHHVTGRPRRPCTECAHPQAGCRTVVHLAGGSLVYVCQQCWTSCGYGSPAAAPHYLRKDECPVTQ